jgi:hypothetical protein
MNEDLEPQAAQMLQPSATDGSRLGLAKSVARHLVAQHGAEAAAPAIQYARNLSLGIDVRPQSQKSAQPSVLGASRR